MFVLITCFCVVNRPALPHKITHTNWCIVSSPKKYVVGSFCCSYVLDNSLFTPQPCWCNTKFACIYSISYSHITHAIHAVFSNI